MTNDIEDLEEIIPDISSDLKEKFIEFFELISQYNMKINLVGKSTIPRAGVKHFSDSYQGLKFIETQLLGDKPIFDFGSGNGFPGIIAALLFPDQSILMVERDHRKAEFLKLAAAELELTNVEVHSGNVSDLQEGSCHKVISRAMAPLPKFLLGSRAVVPVGGEAYLFKGEHWSTEFSSIPAQVFDFWDVQLMGSYTLPRNEGDRYMVLCKRIGS